jgi:hypothetical protein
MSGALFANRLAERSEAGSPIGLLGDRGTVLRRFCLLGGLATGVKACGFTEVWASDKGIVCRHLRR